MTADIHFVKILKIRLSILDLHLSLDQEIYDVILHSFIKANEGEKLHVYLDIKGNLTVGIGFNMSTLYAEKIWHEIFSDSLSFHQVKSGKISITPKQSKLLYDHIKNNNRIDLKNIYRTSWLLFKPNEQMMIEDLYWNGGNKLVGMHTNFYKNMILYTARLELKYLEAGLLEVRKNSNPERSRGIQNRRNIQAEMGSYV